MTTKLTSPMLKALKVAASRERGNLCPVRGVHAHAETMLLDGLRRRGLIDGLDNDGRGIPYINAAGRASVASSCSSQ